MIRFRTLAAIVAVLVLAPASHANLLTNGSFEDGNFVPNFQDTMSLSTGSIDMTGWTTISAEIAWINEGNPFGVVASDGIKSLDLAGYHDSAPYGGVQQSIATGVGSVYLLEFDLGTIGPVGVQRSIQASAGATSGVFTAIGTLNQQEWTTFGLQFVADSSLTSISLLGTNEGGNYIGLDNARVTLISVAVPEPSTAALVLLPLAVALFRRKSASRIA